MPRLLAFALCLLCFPVAAFGADEPQSTTPKPPVFEPAKTRVLVLPTISKVGDQVAKTANAPEQAQKMIEEQFSQRGFVTATAEEVKKALAAAKIDLTDLENYTKDQIAAAGKEAGVALAVGTVLQAFESDARNLCVLRVKVLDVGAGNYLVNGVFKGEKGGLSRKKGRLAAMGNAVEKALVDLLKPYKVVPPPPTDAKPEGQDSQK